MHGNVMQRKCCNMLDLLKVPSACHCHRHHLNITATLQELLAGGDRLPQRPVQTLLRLARAPGAPDKVTKHPRATSGMASSTWCLVRK